eukprot:g2430.t1
MIPRTYVDDIRLDVYDQWRDVNVSGTRVLDGYISWPPPLKKKTRFSMLPGIMSRDEVRRVLELVDPVGKPRLALNENLDTVDSMKAHEIFIHQGDMDGGGGEEDAATNRARRQLREKLSLIMNPVEERVTRFVRQRWPRKCNRSQARACRACFSLVRRYFPDERLSHNIHRDGQAIVTAVISLSDYGSEYRGGLYVAANGKPRQALALSRGDAAVHGHDLLHGVQVLPPARGVRPKRWSWILWFKDSESCEQHGHEWSRSCARKGDALCQFLYSWRVFLNPKLTQKEIDAERAAWMLKSADGGFGEAMFKIGRIELGERKVHRAVGFFQRAIAAGEVDACYQIAHLLLLRIIEPSDDAISREDEALEMLECAAAAGASPFGGSAYAMYNLGVAYLYGFAGLRRNVPVALSWFQKSGLPEGLMAMSLHARASGDMSKARLLQARADAAGFGVRQQRRDQALFGLHCNWPGFPGPPRW